MKMKQQEANVDLQSSKRKRLLPLFLFALICSATAAEHKLTARALTEWIKHVQLKDGHGRADGEEFYLYKGKNWTPQKELQSTINLINTDIKIGRLNQLPQCAFPARTNFIKKYNLAKIVKQKCKDYEMWKKGINAESISMIYASSFPNNPASTFGHTFIRFNSRNKLANRDLLDYGLNFAATTGNDGGVEFAFFGIFGFYEGHFSIAPYYIKTNEYNNYENRNLWEYKLKYTEEEVSTLLDYIWELESTTYFDYYFFDENCSYMLLTLLEKIRPYDDLTSKTKFYVAPLDTIKILDDHNLIADNKYRPSLKTIFKGHFYDLSYKKKIEFHNLIAGTKLPDSVSVQSLDTAIHYYKEKQFRGKLAGMSKKRFYKILEQRARTKGHPRIKHIKETDPLKGHDSYIAGIGHHTLDDRGHLNLMAGIGIHNIYDNDTGYIPFSNIELLKASINIDRKLRTYLDRFVLIDVKSFEPFTLASKSISWQLESEIQREIATSWDTRILAGPTLELAKATRLYLQFGPYQEVSSSYEWGLSVKIGAIQANSLGKTLIEYEKLYNRFEDWNSQISVGQSVHVNDQASFILKYQRKRTTSLRVLWNQHF